MEFNPPIATRDTEELIEILAEKESWNTIAIDQAKEELYIRNISDEAQYKKIQNYFLNKKAQYFLEMEARSTESHSILEIITMIIKWPNELFRRWSLKNDGYLILHRQRKNAIITGMVMYTLIFIWMYNIDTSINVETMNEISTEDIYEWEKKHYSDKEFIDDRNASIDKIFKIFQHSTGDERPILLIENDTLLYSQLNKLRDIDPLNIRNISFIRKGDDLYDKIIIKLVHQ